MTTARLRRLEALLELLRLGRLARQSVEEDQLLDRGAGLFVGRIPTVRRGLDHVQQLGRVPGVRFLMPRGLALWLLEDGNVFGRAPTTRARVSRGAPCVTRPWDVAAATTCDAGDVGIGSGSRHRFVPTR